MEGPEFNHQYHPPKKKRNIMYHNIRDKTNEANREGRG
jgi:hypothetical protein